MLLSPLSRVDWLSLLLAPSYTPLGGAKKGGWLVRTGVRRWGGGCWLVLEGGARSWVVADAHQEEEIAWDHRHFWALETESALMDP